MNKKPNRQSILNKKVILISFFLLIIILVLFLFKDFGVHIEEKFHRQNGLYWLNYIATTFDLENLSSITQSKLSNIYDYTLSPVKKFNKYGVILDLPMAAIEILFKLENINNIYKIKHLLSFCIFLISSFYFYLILKKRFKNIFICLFGTFFFITSPRIFGDSFLYKDVLFLSIINIAIYYLIETIESLDKKNLKNLILFSVFSAMAFNLRVFALVVPIGFFFIILIKNFYIKKTYNYLTIYFIYLLLFFLFIYFFSPYLWSSPLENFLQIFYSLKKDLIGPEIKVLFNGEYIYNRYVPDTYILTWIFITTPIIIIMLFIPGYIFYLKRFLKRFFQLKEVNYFNDLWRGKKEEIDFLMFFFLSSYFLLFLIFNSPFYNGWRLVYFINIFIIYFFTYAIYLVNCYLKKKFIKIFDFLLLISAFYNIYILLIFHPFQSLYFNEIKKNNIYLNYEIDYYGLAGKDFFMYLDNLDNSNTIKVSVASHTPLQRALEAFNLGKQKKFIIVGQEYQLSDYIFKNNISEVNPKLNKKYDIPNNFVKIKEVKINKILLYEVFKKIN